MFDGITLYTIKYADTHIVNSLSGVQVGNEILYSGSAVSQSSIFLEDCSFLLDGMCHTCPQYPISQFAREHLFYIQSFSFWESGNAYYTKRKNLDSFLLVYTYEGKGWLEYRGQSFLLQEGDAFLIDCREPHFYRTECATWKHSDLHFDGNLGEYLYKDFVKENGNIFHPKSESDFQNSLEHLLYAYISIDPYREYQVSALLNQLFVSILAEMESYTRSQQNMPDQLKYLVHYVNNNYTHELSLEFLSDFFSISKYHLCRSFKKYTGFTLNDYITQLRLEQAKELLRTTALPANKICFAVGINDENYFYRLFKKHVGISPQKYRKN